MEYHNRGGRNNISQLVPHLLSEEFEVQRSDWRGPLPWRGNYLVQALILVGHQLPFDYAARPRWSSRRVQAPEPGSRWRRTLAAWWRAFRLATRVNGAGFLFQARGAASSQLMISSGERE